jgi:hypothetical protein
MNDTWPTALEVTAFFAAIAYIWGEYIKRGGRR